MTSRDLGNHVRTQIRNVFACDVSVHDHIDTAITRTRTALTRSASKYSPRNLGQEVPFSVFNSAQYCLFLYYLANTIFVNEGSGVNAEKVYYLNKVLNSVDIFYEVSMPEIFGVEHPLGSIMGRAQYSDFFFFYQGCTVGGSKGNYPVIGNNVLMYSNSKILGRAYIGDNVILSANAYVIDQTIPSNCIVFGQAPNLVIKEKNESSMIQLTRHVWR